MNKETVEKRRKEIFEAALDVFAEKNFEEATLDEIAQKVKISKPALYLYFKNKEDLFASMVEEILSNNIFTIKDILKLDITVIEKLKKIIVLHVESFVKNEKFFKIMHQIKILMDTKKKNKIHQTILEHYQEYTNSLITLMQKGIEEKCLKDEDPTFMAFSFLGIIKHNFFRCIIFNDYSSLKKIDKQILNLFLKGAGR